MARAASSGAAPERAPAQLYCAAAGAALLVAGIVGFFVDASFGGASHRGELIVFDVNGWHDVVHVLSGLLLLAAAPAARPARAVALGFGVVYGAVAVWGIVDGHDVVGLVPVNGADNILHVALAVLGVLAGLAPARAGAVERRRSLPDPDRYGIAADASSPKQVFVGVRH